MRLHWTATPFRREPLTCWRTIIVLGNLLKLYADLTFLSLFNVYRGKLTTLEVSVAKCLDVLSTDLPSGQRDPLQLTGSTSSSFPAWHVKYFLLKLRGVFRGGGLQKFLTKELKVQCFFFFDKSYMCMNWTKSVSSSAWVPFATVEWLFLLAEKSPAIAESATLNQYANYQAPVVERVDDAIHWINLYPVDRTVCLVDT